MALSAPNVAGVNAAAIRTAIQRTAISLRLRTSVLRVLTCLPCYSMSNAARYFAGSFTGFISRLQKMWRVEPVASLRSPSARRIS